MGYSLGAIDWDDTFIGEFFGGHVRAVFSLITIIFVCCVSITVASFSEIPLPLLEELHQEQEELNHPPKPGGGSSSTKRHSEEIPMSKDLTGESSYGTLAPPTNKSRVSKSPANHHNLIIINLIAPISWIHDATQLPRQSPVPQNWLKVRSDNNRSQRCPQKRHPLTKISASPSPCHYRPLLMNRTPPPLSPCPWGIICGPLSLCRAPCGWSA